MSNNLHRYTVMTEYWVRKTSTRSFFAQDEEDARFMGERVITKEQKDPRHIKVTDCVKEAP